MNFDIPKSSIILRSICVNPALLGSPIANDLIVEFESVALSLGVDHVALTTPEHNNNRTLRFYKKHGYDISHAFMQGWSRAMLLMTKKLTSD